MKITKVTYRMLRQTKQFENDTVEMEAELGPKDKLDDVVAQLKRECFIALGLTPMAAVKCTVSCTRGHR